MWTRSERFMFLSPSFVLLGLQYIGKLFHGAGETFLAWFHVSVDTQAPAWRSQFVFSYRIVSSCPALSISTSCRVDGWLIGDTRAAWTLETTRSCLQRGKDISWHAICAQVLCGVCPSCLETATIRGITRTSLQAQCVGLTGFTGFRSVFGIFKSPSLYYVSWCFMILQESLGCSCGMWEESSPESA